MRNHELDLRFVQDKVVYDKEVFLVVNVQQWRQFLKSIKKDFIKSDADVMFVDRVLLGMTRYDKRNDVFTIEASIEYAAGSIEPTINVVRKRHTGNDKFQVETFPIVPTGDIILVPLYGRYINLDKDFHLQEFVEKAIPVIPEAIQRDFIGKLTRVA